MLAYQINLLFNTTNITRIKTVEMRRRGEEGCDCDNGGADGSTQQLDTEARQQAGNDTVSRFMLLRCLEENFLTRFCSTNLKQEDNFENRDEERRMDLKITELEVVDWFHLAPDRGR
jgi:hypothetical protein